MSQAEKLLNKAIEEHNQAVNNAIKTATEAMYEKVLQYCYENNIVEHTDRIFMEFDPINNIGKVWSGDAVIIFNEMGTGIVGSNDPHPNPLVEWTYDVNQHGEKGWKYPKEDGTFGWTKGLPSRHMFYSAFEDIKDKIGDIVSVTLNQTGGWLYGDR